jgi:hypothetical protein
MAKIVYLEDYRFDLPLTFPLDDLVLSETDKIFHENPEWKGLYLEVNMIRVTTEAAWVRIKITDITKSNWWSHAYLIVFMIVLILLYFLWKGVL